MIFREHLNLTGRVDLPLDADRLLLERGVRRDRDDVVLKQRAQRPVRLRARVCEALPVVRLRGAVERTDRPAFFTHYVDHAAAQTWLVDPDRRRELHRAVAAPRSVFVPDPLSVRYRAICRLGQRLSAPRYQLADNRTLNDCERRRVRPVTVGRELGHGGDSLVRRVYGHLGDVRQRLEVVEYRIETAAEAITDVRARNAFARRAQHLLAPQGIL